MRRELQANGHFGRLEANFRSLRIETSGVKRSGRAGIEASARKTLQRGSRARGCMHTCARAHGVRKRLRAKTAAARHLSLWPLVYR